MRGKLTQAYSFTCIFRVEKCTELICKYVHKSTLYNAKNIKYHNNLTHKLVTIIL